MSLFGLVTSLFHWRAISQVLGTVLRAQYNREIRKGIIQPKERLAQGRGLEYQEHGEGQGRAWSKGPSQSGIPVSQGKLS